MQTDALKGRLDTPKEDKVQFAASMMHGFYTFLFLYLLTWLGQNASGSEIINGKKAKANSMLYMASVQNKNSHVCGGFLVSEDFVMTAAHCDKADLTRVVLGTHKLQKIDNNTLRHIEKKCKPPSYKKPASGHDIMLLKLSKKAQLGNRIKLIDLPRTDSKIKDNQMCSVAGWGKIKTDSNIVDELQEVKVPVINMEVCKKEWKEIRVNLPSSVICAGGYNTNKGFCKGDSGGPLVCNGMAVGIVSFNINNNCTYPNLPNIYTDISKYLPWIKNILKKKEC